MDATLERNPRQRRSRQTREALLDAAEELGRTRTFDQLTVQEVAARAGFTVGALYARFPSKAALLAALMARYEAMIDAAKQSLDPAQADSGVVRRLADAFVQGYRKDEGRLRLIESALRSSADHAARLTAIRSALLDFVIAALARSYPVPRPDLETAALLLVVPLRELHFKREFWPERPGSAAALTTRVVDTVTWFLESRRGAPRLGRGQGRMR